MQTKDELFTSWSELRRQPLAESHIFSDVARRASEELTILESLRAADCTHIPGESADIDTLIKDRRRLQQEILDNLS